MELKTVVVSGQPAYVWDGGSGPPMVLLHGSWGGAQTQWSYVYDRLSHGFRIVLPELPGIGDHEQLPLKGFSAYADWLGEVLKQIHVGKAWIVGNSFGAAVAWKFASHYPTRVLGLVLVNGGPSPAMPAWMLRFLRVRPALALAAAVVKKSYFSPSTLQRAFADPAKAPAELGKVFRGDVRSRVDAVIFSFVAEEDPSKKPEAPVLALFGTKDRLNGNVRRIATWVLRRHPAARIQFIEDAGHLPQLEQPDAFVAALEHFVATALHR